MAEETASGQACGCMEALQTAGRIIIENGGETYRAEETICRMGQGMGLTEVESFAVPSGLFISYRRPDGQLETSVKRIHRKGTNLIRIDRVNDISRKVSAGGMSTGNALAELRGIELRPGPYTSGWLLAGAFVCAAGFALLFGGGFPEVLAAGLVAGIVQAAGMLSSRFHVQWIFSSIVGGFLTSLLPHLICRYLPAISLETVIAGALMPLVPGLAMTNAVQDTMRGDMVSGLSHGAQAVLTACLVAGGALVANALMRILEGGILP